MSTPRREVTERAIAFVDLAGFTALTDAHGDDRAADTQQVFLAALRSAMGEAVECVKHLGDGALLAATDPTEMLRCLAALARDWAVDPHAPLLRAGAQVGPVLRVVTEHGPDYLGGTVNTAARLCERAGGGQVVLGAGLTGAAHDAGLVVRALGELELRGLAERVDAALAALTDVDGGAIDPVCRMPVPAGTEAGRLEHDGATWVFCSLECAGRFALDPPRWTR